MQLVFVTRHIFASAPIVLEFVFRINYQAILNEFLLDERFVILLLERTRQLIIEHLV